MLDVDSIVSWCLSPRTFNDLVCAVSADAVGCALIAHDLDQRLDGLGRGIAAQLRDGWVALAATMATNGVALFERPALASTAGSWLDGQVWGFHLRPPWR